MCAWTAPKTYTVGSVLTAAELNTHLRDNMIYLKGTTGLTVIEGTLCAENSTVGFKHLLNRQGGTSSSWTDAGTNNYLTSGVFLQAGTIAISITTAQAAATATVTLPIPLSAGANAVAFCNGIASFSHIFAASIDGTTELDITISQKQSSSGYLSASNYPVNWLIVGR